MSGKNTSHMFRSLASRADLILFFVFYAIRPNSGRAFQRKNEIKSISNDFENWRTIMI